MANFQLAGTFRYYTPTAISEVAGRPATNLGLYAYPFRTWRSTAATSGHYVTLDLASKVAIGAVFLNNCNFSTVNVGLADDTAGPWTTTGYTVALDKRVNRRKMWVPVGASWRYVRITPTALAAEATYVTGWELGTCGILDPIVTLADNPAWPFRYMRRQATTRIGYISGGEDVTEDGMPYLEFTLGNPLWRKLGSTIQSQLFDLINLGPAAPIVLYENAGDTSRCYLVRRVEDVQFEELTTSFAAEIPFREAI